MQENGHLNKMTQFIFSEMPMFVHIKNYAKWYLSIIECWLRWKIAFCLRFLLGTTCIIIAEAGRGHNNIFICKVHGVVMQENIHLNKMAQFIFSEMLMFVHIKNYGKWYLSIIQSWLRWKNAFCLRLFCKTLILTDFIICFKLFLKHVSS